MSELSEIQVHYTNETRADALIVNLNTTSCYLVKLLKRKYTLIEKQKKLVRKSGN